MKTNGCHASQSLPQPHLGVRFKGWPVCWQLIWVSCWWRRVQHQLTKHYSLKLFATLHFQYCDLLHCFTVLLPSLFLSSRRQQLFPGFLSLAFRGPMIVNAQVTPLPPSGRCKRQTLTVKSLSRLHDLFHVKGEMCALTFEMLKVSEWPSRCSVYVFWPITVQGSTFPRSRA